METLNLTTFSLMRTFEKKKKKKPFVANAVNVFVQLEVIIELRYM